MRLGREELQGWRLRGQYGDVESSSVFQYQNVPGPSPPVRQLGASSSDMILEVEVG